MLYYVSILCSVHLCILIIIVNRVLHQNVYTFGIWLKFWQSNCICETVFTMIEGFKIKQLLKNKYRFRLYTSSMESDRRQGEELIYEDICPVGILLLFVQCFCSLWLRCEVFSSRDHEWQSSSAADELRVWDRPPPSPVRAARRFGSRWRVQRCHLRGGGEALSCTQSHSGGPLPVFQVSLREMSIGVFLE